MMRARAACGALVALLLLAACHRAEVGEAPDADADLRAKTAAKTSDDLAAADAAARAPLPHVAAPPPRPMADRDPGEETPPDDAALPGNDAG